MSKQLLKFVFIFLVTGLFIACNSTKETTTKTVEKKVEKPKDTNVYNLVGHTAESHKKGIEVTKLYASKNGTFKVTPNGGAQQVGTITYFMLDEAYELIYEGNEFSKLYMKDDFSLDYMMNGERQLSYEYGKLNGKEIFFNQSENGVWQAKNRDEIPDELLGELGTEEAKVAHYQTSETVKLPKTFYPSAVQVGDSWDVNGDDLRWILDGLTSSYDATGKMTLKEVVKEEEEPIAIISFNFAINFISVFNNASPPLKKQLAFEGEIRRSLKDFIDKKVVLEGAYNITRVKPKQGDVPQLDIDIQSTGVLTYTEELLDN